MNRLYSLLPIVFLAFSAQSAISACPGLLDHKLQDLDGKPVDLCQFSGKVVVAVNTASYCGFTPQYKGLEALYQKYRNQGLVVVGFPANDFGRQEPGSNQEIKDFCELTYGVKFPMMEKTSVVPGKANPLFSELARMTGEQPKWNFHKYVISRDGKRAFSYPSSVTPDSEELVRRIEALLAEKG